MSHTPTPWQSNRYPGREGTTTVFRPSDKVAIATCSVADDAERITDCVNACEGITDPGLTIPLAGRAMIDAADAIRRLLRHFPAGEGGCSVSHDIAIAKRALLLLGAPS